MSTVEILLDEVGVQSPVLVTPRHGDDIGAIAGQRLRAELWRLANCTDASQRQPVRAANFTAERGALATREALQKVMTFSDDWLSRQALLL